MKLIQAQNMNNKTTTFTYDKANQLATSTTDDKVTSYAYDAAGRLIKEGSVASGFKTYQYGWLDKILEVQENGQQIAAFDYHVGGQIAQATHGDKSENFLWDGLALIHRGENSYVNEPYVTGGNPILSSKDGVMFNDILGTTLGVKNEKGFNAVSMTAFGEPTTSQPHNSTTEIGEANFFTGKPYIGELGYAFLFRNYRAEQGKWQTSDPLGYPDGWNNLAYVNNGVTSSFDTLGLCEDEYGWIWVPTLYNPETGELGMLVYDRIGLIPCQSTTSFVTVRAITSWINFGTVHSFTCGQEGGSISGSLGSFNFSFTIPGSSVSVGINLPSSTHTQNIAATGCTLGAGETHATHGHKSYQMQYAITGEEWVRTFECGRTETFMQNIFIDSRCQLVSTVPCTKKE